MINPQKTLGFFTNRNSFVPFYFTCVMANLVDSSIIEGSYPVIRVVNDMPALTPGITKGGFISIKMNDGVARPDEYISVPGSLDIITVKEITGSNIKGSFSTLMRCTSDSLKQIKVNGSFDLQQ